MDIRRRTKVTAQANMSSMTDLVFLLLIFFIVMATMAKEALPVDLPTAGGTTKEGSEVRVGIDKDNGFFMDRKKKNFYTLEELAPILQQKMLEENQTKVSIYSDKAAEVQNLVELMVLIKDNGWNPVITLQN
jgi:biopolymer transport protein ExbD